MQRQNCDPEDLKEFISKEENHKILDLYFIDDGIKGTTEKVEELEKVFGLERVEK